MPMERAEAAGACALARQRLAFPQVGNLRYKEGEAVGGARRLPTCGYEEQGRGWQGASAG